MNEIANLCEIVGADVDAYAEELDLMISIGKRFLFPGIGYGGSCFPKDVQALVYCCRFSQVRFSNVESCNAG
jgi:UDPglucose 6-dehydrogenase